MRFYKASNSYPYKPLLATKYPCVTLSHDVWDDYGHRSVFHARYYSGPGAELYLGRVKILQREQKIPDIPLWTEQLSPEFCSLGESIAYYERLRDIPQSHQLAIVNGLRDAAVFSEIAADFELDEGWRGSLLRYSEAEKAFREAREILGLDMQSERLFAFEFSTTVPGAARPHVVSLDFSTDGAGLHRIAALIGRNGTGKTQFLGNFAHAMSGRNRNKGMFAGGRRPSFNRIIAVSYSVFDQFEKPQGDTDTFSYRYCGIWELVPSGPASDAPGKSDSPTPSRLLSPEDMWERANASVKKIVKKSREENWRKILSELLGANVPFDTMMEDDGLDPRFYHHLSSGQRILTLVMTEVIAHIERDSLILFDEPELHLHPDVLSALARALHILLEEFQSFAILATHSPILLQEIPRSHVRVFHRQGNVPSVRELTIESFGENLSIITDEIFGTTSVRNNYREILRRLYKERGFEGVMRLFDNKLGFNARAFLATLGPDSDIGSEGEWDDETTWEIAE